MRNCSNPRFRWLVLSLALALPLAAAEKPVNFQPVTPGPVDGRIATVTASMLEQLHYLKQPFDLSVSTNFFDNYLEEFDPQHLHFLQSDLAEFDHYRTNLHLLTKTATGVADTRPACEIFNRFMERLAQRIAYVDELLKTEKFTFDDNAHIVLNRKDVPYPKDLKEAQALWRERLRFEYLQERLGKKNLTNSPAAPASLELKGPKTKSTPPAPPAQASASDANPQERAREAVREKLAELSGTGQKNPPEPVASSSGSKPTAAALAETKPAKSESEEIAESLARRYNRNLRAYAEFDHEDVLQRYLTALSRIYDPHSDYYGRAQVESFAIAMNLSLYGIGAELGAEDDYCTIRRLLPGGPAEKSKQVKVNDRIIAVAQGDGPSVDIVGMTVSKAVQLIRGPKGTVVRLTIMSGNGDATKEVVTLVRDEIKLEDQAAKAKIIELPDADQPNVRLGVIDLPSFYAPFAMGMAADRAVPADAVGKWTSLDVAHFLKKFKEENVAGVILDLRRNGGGSLEEAIKLTGLFIKEGPVVQVRDRKGTIEENGDTDSSVAYDGPLIVLTSRFSASASEIVAGALQDYGRALIVGDASTHGKGTVQSVPTLKPYVHLPEALATNDPGALKVTIKKFYRAGGSSTQKEGVIPDIILPSVLNDSKEIGEASLDHALEHDTIPSAKFEPVNRVKPYLPELLKRSSVRVASDPDYSYIREDIETYKKRVADKTISLNEQERRREKAEEEARNKARDKERLARQEPLEKVHDLKLKDADLPGLPPVTPRTNTVAKITGADGKPDGDEEERPPAVDPSLTEAEHILVDYLSLLSKADVLTAGHPANNPPPARTD